MAYIPNYILKVYNPEYYSSSQVVAMPMQLKANEYWELISVEGASADFMGLDSLQGADLSGSLFTYPTYEDRQIEFTLAIKRNHEADAETYLSRYLQPNVYATLYNADWGENVFMQCVIAEWSLNRYSNNMVATIAIQPIDRAWHKTGVDLEFDGNETVLQTDLPAQPDFWADFWGGVTSTKEVTNVNLKLTRITYTPSIYSDDMQKNKDVKYLNLVCPEGCPANMVYMVQVHFGARRISLIVKQSSGFRTLELSMPMDDYNWDWALASGTWQIECTLVYDSGSASAIAYRGVAHPRYAVCPRVITDPVDGFAFSPNLKAENIKKGVEILGVIGTNEWEGIKFDFTKKSPYRSENDGSAFSEKITRLDVKALNIPSNISNFGHFFGELSNLQNFTNLNELNTASATNMNSMFTTCWNLTSLDLSSFNTSLVTDMRYMFLSCFSLTSLKLTSFDTSQVTDMKYMFANCEKLPSLKLNSFNTSLVTDMSYMFFGCSSLTDLELSPNWASNNAILSVDLSSCPLTKASVLDVLSKLADRTTTSNAPTLRLSQTTKALLSDDEIKVATDKGWTVAS